MPRGRSGLTDAGLLSYSVNFRARIVASADEYHLQPADIDSYIGIQERYAQGYQLAIDPPTRTSVTVAEKRAARKRLELSLKFLETKIRSVPITAAQKLALGLNVRKPWTRISSPDEAPILVATDVRVRTVSVKLIQQSGKRGKPPRVHGARLFYHLGPEPAPPDLTHWHYGGQTSSAKCDVHFPLEVPMGSKVFITAAWLSPTQKMGPAAPPMAVYLGHGMTMNAA